MKYSFFLFVAISFSLPSQARIWTNWFKTESVKPQSIQSPGNAKELINVVKAAARDGKRVRMTGNGHAASDVAITQDYLILPGSLNHPLTVDCRRLKVGCDESLVRAQSGIKIADLNQYLDQQGRALINMGGYDGQTLAGIFMTATHGSGLNYGPMVDALESMQMVSEEGKILQIEPTQGITDPGKWQGVLEEDPSVPVELIQDDEAFNAARVSIGSMGIVYSLTFRTSKKYWLREVRHLISWTELKRPGGYLDRMMRGLPIYGDNQPSPEHWEIQYSPYKNSKGDHTFLITDRYHSSTPLPEQKPSQRGKPGADFTSGLIRLLGHPLAIILDTFPKLARPVLESALKAEVDPNYTNVSYKVFNIGTINYTPVLGIEMAFSLSQTVAAVERSFEISEEMLAQGIPLSSPMSFRFVKKSNAMIAMSYGQDSSFLEIIALRDGRGSKKLLQTYQKDFYARFKSRPHWGLDLNLLTSERQVRELYPESFDRWLTQFRRFNSSGIFDGQVTDRLGISIHPRPYVPAPEITPEKQTGLTIETALSEVERKKSFQDRKFVLPVVLSVLGESKDQRQLRQQVLERNRDVKP